MFGLSAVSLDTSDRYKDSTPPLQHSTELCLCNENVDFGTTTQPIAIVEARW